MQLTDWLLVEVAQLLIGLTQISWTKSGFNHPSVIDSPLWLRAQGGIRNKLYKDDFVVVSQSSGHLRILVDSSEESHPHKPKIKNKVKLKRIFLYFKHVIQLRIHCNPFRLN